MAIFFSNVDVNFRLNNKRIIKNWIINCLVFYGYKLGNINIAFCSDSYIKKINSQFLNHNYYTDVITFPYSEDKIISSDVLISIDTVKSNSELYQNIFQNELQRVIIHAILHLVGFDDKEESSELLMRSTEDYWLKKLQCND